MSSATQPRQTRHLTPAREAMPWPPAQAGWSRNINRRSSATHPGYPEPPQCCQPAVYNGCTRDAHRVHMLQPLVLPSCIRCTPLVHASADRRNDLGGGGGGLRGGRSFGLRNSRLSNGLLAAGLGRQQYNRAVCPFLAFTAFLCLDGHYQPGFRGVQRHRLPGGIAQHIPDKGAQMVRYCGWYSTKTCPATPSAPKTGRRELLGGPLAARTAIDARTSP